MMDRGSSSHFPAGRDAAFVTDVATRRLDMEAVSKYVKDGTERETRLIIYDLGGQRVFYTLHQYVAAASVPFPSFSFHASCRVYAGSASSNA